MAFKLAFRIDKELDKQVIACFLDVSAGGVSFTESIRATHPHLLESLQMARQTAWPELIGNYTDKFYKQHAPELAEIRGTWQNEWEVVGKEVVQTINGLFGGTGELSGEYAGYVSTVDCNPRFLERREFQVFYRHNLGVIFVVTHELLHFAFYSYVAKTFPEYGTLSTEDGPFWDMAEIFNSVVLSDERFSRITSIKEPIYYPHHEKYVKTLQKVWNAEPNVDMFIKSIAKHLELSPN